MIMRKIFKFSYFDYYLPLSEQCKQIRQLEDPEEILKYSLCAVIKAKPEILGPNVVYDKILMNLIESNDPKTTPDKVFSAFKIEGNCEQGKEKKLKLDSITRGVDADSFQSLWEIVNFNKEECFLGENTKWIIKQSDKLIFENKLDLHHMSLIYGILGDNNGPYDLLWEYYDRLMSNYILDLNPEEFLIVVKAYSNSRVIDKSESKWLRSLNYNLHFFHDFSINQLINYVISVNSLNILISPLLIDKLVKEVKNPNDFHHLYIMIKYNGFKPSEKNLKEILKTMPNNRKFEFVQIFSRLNLDNQFLELILDSLLSDQGPHDIDKIYSLSKIFTLKNLFFSHLHQLIQPLYPILDTFSIHDYKKFLEILCVLKNADFSFSEDLLDNVTKKFYEFKDQVNHQNFQVFVHFFTYSMPVRAIHRILCQKILENEKDDAIMKTRPRHEYNFKNSEGMIVVYFNELLVNLTFTSLIDVLICLQFRYQVNSEVRAVLKKYLKLILLNHDHKLAVKFRSKLAIMLGIPENFDRELIGLLLDNISRNTKMKNAMLQVYPFMQALKNLKNLEYIHPEFDSLPNSIPLPTELELHD